MINSKKSFVLIELLVVVAVIGILASVIVVAVNGTREKARDAKRKLDLANINAAIKLYYQAKGYYPNPGGKWCHSGMTVADVNHVNDCWSTLETELNLEGLVSTLPKDPINNCPLSNNNDQEQTYTFTFFYNTPQTRNCYAYVYIHRDIPFDDGSYSYAIEHEPQYYDLITRLENKSDPQRCQLKCYVAATFNYPGWQFCPGGSGLPACPNPVGVYYRPGQNEIYSARK